jgi:C-terminal processing protease CtpA/Prc
MARRPARSIVLPLLLLCASAASAGERGYFGFGLEVATKGFFLSPEITSLKISKVVPGTPADRVGIRAGDTILRVEDMAVVGSKALDLKARAAKDVGQPLHLQLRHADGQVFAVNMVAVPRP